MDMKLIGESSRLKFAALPIGDNFTMGVDDAIKAADFVGCNQVLGLHFNTFAPIRIDAPERRGEIQGRRQTASPAATGRELPFLATCRRPARGKKTSRRPSPG